MIALYYTGLTVQFDPVSYSVTEGGQAALILVLSGPADREVTVEFTTEDDSAVCKFKKITFEILYTDFLSSWS